MSICAVATDSSIASFEHSATDKTNPNSSGVIGESRRMDCVEAPRAVRCLRVGELEVPGRDFRRRAKRGPVAQRQRNVGAGQNRETRAEPVRKGKLEGAIRQLLRAG